MFGNANKLAADDLTVEQRVEIQNGILPSERLASTPQVEEQRTAAKQLAWLAFADILIFFGVLLVGFAYLWNRGDLDWVRSTAAQTELPPSPSEV